MTATVPQQGPPAQGGPTGARSGARLGEVYGYDVRDILQPDEAVAAVVTDDYVGQSRSQRQRDLQHRGLAPERDGVVREKPWADRIVGDAHILERGLWTDAELDERERHWIHALKPRLNYEENLGNPSRIGIGHQHRLRKARDPDWVIPDWSRRRPAPLPVSAADLRRTSPLAVWAHRRWLQVRWWLVVWAVATVAAWIWVAPLPDAVVLAAACTAGLAAMWRRATRPKARTRRANTRRRTR